MAEPIRAVDEDQAAAAMLPWLLPLLMVGSVGSLLMCVLFVASVLPLDARSNNDMWFMLLAMIPLGLWLTRVERAARKQAGMDRADWDAGWWFIIPIGNLWKPYQAVKQIWETSTAREPTTDQQAGNIRVLWWACWLLIIAFPGLSRDMPWGRPAMHVAIAGFLGVSVLIARQLTAARARSRAAAQP